MTHSISKTIARQIEANVRRWYFSHGPAAWALFEAEQLRLWAEARQAGVVAEVQKLLPVGRRAA